MRRGREDLAFREERSATGNRSCLQTGCCMATRLLFSPERVEQVLKEHPCSRSSSLPRSRKVPTLRPSLVSSEQPIGRSTGRSRTPRAIPTYLGRSDSSKRTLAAGWGFDRLLKTRDRQQFVSDAEPPSSPLAKRACGSCPRQESNLRKRFRKPLARSDASLLARWCRRDTAALPWLRRGWKRLNRAISTGGGEWAHLGSN